ncbi:MAG: YlxM family DNA-binding protein [Parasporobacterium sp.]|nr:YlxM family DNA-binding protein [Parasporobacterium sp.]
MENIYGKSLLYDFYGELLNDHQKKIYEDVVLNDLSLSEIAAEEGISRQGVHDLIKRCNKILEQYEEKLKLVEKFLAIKGYIKDIQGKCEEYKSSESVEKTVEDIKAISQKILDEL